jgi:hypothetical protein
MITGFGKFQEDVWFSCQKMKGGVIGVLAGKPMEKQIGRVIEGNLLGLKHYVETGEIATRDVYKRLRRKEKIAPGE